MWEYISPVTLYRFIIEWGHLIAMALPVSIFGFVLLYLRSGTLAALCFILVLTSTFVTREETQRRHIACWVVKKLDPVRYRWQFQDIGRCPPRFLY